MLRAGTLGKNKVETQKPSVNQTQAPEKAGFVPWLLHSGYVSSDEDYFSRTRLHEPKLCLSCLAAVSVRIGSGDRRWSV